MLRFICNLRNHFHTFNIQPETTLIMRIYSPFILLFFFMMAASCTSEEITQEMSLDGKIKKIENEEHRLIGEFSYDKQGNLKSSWSKQEFYTPGKKEEYNYTFNEHQLLVKKEGFQPGNMIMSSMIGAADKNVNVVYEYDDQDRISKVQTDFEYPDNEVLDFGTQLKFEYQATGEVKTVYNTIDELANSVGPQSIYIINAEGNIESIASYYSMDDELRLTSKEEFTYDSNPAPYDPEPGVQSVNNVLSKKLTSYNYDEAGHQSLAYSSEFTYEYEYNSNGYPIKVVETRPNETQFTKYYYY